MRLPKDILTTTSDIIDFILFFYSGEGFTVNDLSSKFHISKWVLYKRVSYWEAQNYIKIVTKLGEYGGKQYKYQITDQMKIYLENSLSVLLKKLRSGLEKSEDK